VNSWAQVLWYCWIGSNLVTALFERVIAVTPLPLITPDQRAQMRPSFPVAIPQVFACSCVTDPTATEPPP
jgi:hypothetical protein